MALLGGWLSAASREQRAVLRALENLTNSKSPVRLESETTGVSFFTVVALRPNGLLIARPRSLRGGLPKDSFVRITLPNHGRKQIRVPILIPQVKLRMTMRYACICGIPTAFSGVCKRHTDRFNTTKFKNLHLQVPQFSSSFRVVDISVGGLRVFAGDDGERLAEDPEANLAPARIRVGERVSVELENLMVRSHVGNTVGFSMTVRNDGYSGRFLLNLLNKLQEQEILRLKMDTT